MLNYGYKKGSTVETVFDYDKDKDGIFLDKDTGIYHEKVLDVIKSLDYVAVKISDEVYDPSFQYYISIDSSDPEFPLEIKGSGTFQTQCSNTNNNCEGVININNSMFGGILLKMVETPYLDSYASAEKEFSRGTWITLPSDVFYYYLNDLKIEKITHDKDTIFFEGTYLYKISDTYYDPDDFIGSYAGIALVNGDLIDGEITEETIAADEGVFVITLNDFYLVVSNGSSVIPEGMWVLREQFSAIKTIIISQ